MSSQSRTPLNSRPPGDPTWAAAFAQIKAQGDLDFVPCAATASILLYAQGGSVICVHHDTLQIERRFVLHRKNITLLAVATANDHLVVSCDEQHLAIVWDWTTGNEVARFASYKPLTAAAWMANGKIAFGNDQGNLILFDPTTSEQISSRTIDQRGLQKVFVPSKTLSWDVRTKHVAFEDVPTIDGIMGIAIYGPGETLFTLGPNDTIQQYDLKHPAMIVANVAHGPPHRLDNLLNLIEGQIDGSPVILRHSDNSVAGDVDSLRSFEHNRSHLPAEKPPGSIAPPTDSGYDSMGHTRDKHQQADEDDGRTVMTDGEQAYLAPDEKDAVILGFANRLCQDVGPLTQHSDAVSTISEILPALLKEFAVRVTHAAIEKEHTQAVSFVRQNRNYISASFRTVIESSAAEERGDAEDQVVSFRSSDLISVEEKINFWNNAPTIDLDPPSDEILLENEDDSWYPESDSLEKFSKQYGFLKATLFPQVSRPLH
ncbi:hypothetical protein G7Y89_g15712 [Cudoniella acicularis]|uniref:Uncharacterized protein n=1 Tax=Cudoniella acicularis TaxID=354080 RepID=A0A8H4VI92_9HELO|nr:hypothetical protein G7Y89_g15712 [Cudoniella acicularis]